MVHASEVVGMDESPLTPIRKKKDSSIKVAFDLLKKGEASALVSAGNSGAVLATAVFVLEKLKGVDRPAIGTIFPTLKGWTLLLDAGANVDCKPFHLVQFAIMGDAYAKYILKKNKPMVGLLSNGEEESKGNELIRETNAILQKEFDRLHRPGGRTGYLQRPGGCGDLRRVCGQCGFKDL